MDATEPTQKEIQKAHEEIQGQLMSLKSNLDGIINSFHDKLPYGMLIQALLDTAQSYANRAQMNIDDLIVLVDVKHFELLRVRENILMMMKRAMAAQNPDIQKATSIPKIEHARR